MNMLDHPYDDLEEFERFSYEADYLAQEINREYNPAPSDPTSSDDMLLRIRQILEV